MPVRPTFTMAELVERTGVPRATVHSWARQGLLPPAEKVSRNRFRYDERHVRALRLIRLLRDRRGLGLDDIRAILDELLGDEHAEAFEPELWEQAVGALERLGERSPRQRLLHAGIVLYGERGIAATSIEDLSEHAGIAKGSFYRHFASKEQLLFAAAAEVVRGAVHRCQIVHDDGAVVPAATADNLRREVAAGLPLLMDVAAGALRGFPGYGTALGHARSVLLHGLQQAAVPAGVALSDAQAVSIGREAVRALVSGAMPPPDGAVEDEPGS